MTDSYHHPFCVPTTAAARASDEGGTPADCSIVCGYCGDRIGMKPGTPGEIHTSWHEKLEECIIALREQIKALR